MSGRFGHASDTFSACDHDLHRNRRKAISPFFAAAKIADFQSTIRAKLDKLCSRLDEYAGNEGSVVALDRAWMALTTDVVTEYAFAKSYDQLSSPGFEETLHEAMMTIFVTGQFGLHFPIVFPILDALPEWLVRLVKPELMSVLGLRKVRETIMAMSGDEHLPTHTLMSFHKDRTLTALQDQAAEVSRIRAGINTEHKSKSHPTIFHELLNSAQLPEEEKSDTRLGDEAQLIISAGLLTTAWALSVASYHLALNPSMATRLREELRGVEQPYDWRRLERLPYLNGVIHEATRLAHGLTTRDPRLAPDTELYYGEWTIPRNTPVSMTTYHILMNEEVFPDPKLFVPERWVGRPDLERYFVPFGKGSRQCLGIK